MSLCFQTTVGHTTATNPMLLLRYWKPEKFRAVGVSLQRQQMRYNHRERLRQENTQTIVAARADMHRNPPLKLDPSEVRVLACVCVCVCACARMCVYMHVPACLFPA